MSAELRQAIEAGRIHFADPRPCGSGLYLVLITDVETGETTEKTFISHAKACSWVASQISGVPLYSGARVDLKVAKRASRDRRVASVLDDDDPKDDESIAEGLANDAGLQRPATVQAVSSQVKQGGRKPYGFRVKAVREVLESYGLDPTAELVKVLQARKPIYRNGQQVIDDATGEAITEPVLDAKTSASVLIDMQQYVTPKLKAIETRIIDERPKTVDEIDGEIARLLAKRDAQAEKGGVL